jgi:hypothetical protein
MSIAFSRTGVSTLRMQAAAQAFLASGGADSGAFAEAASVCQLRQNSDQVAHALRFIRDMGQGVSVMTSDLRCSIRAPLLDLDQRTDGIWLRLAATPGDRIATTGPLILSGRFLGRPLVCTLDPARTSDPAEFRVATPAWMLLAEQRRTYRVKPPGCRLLTSWGELAPVLNLSDSGLAVALAGAPPLPVSEGAGWSGMLVHDDLDATIPVYLSIVHAVPQGVAGVRIGAALHVADRGARLQLRRLISRHIDLFAEM